MKKPMKTALTRRGFTILELLVVISIIAIIATLATGAAVKSMKQSRARRITVMAKGLEVALANYRAQENKWPFALNNCVDDKYDKTYVWIHGQNNFQAFQKLYGDPTHYLDESAYLVTVQGRRSALKEALKNGGRSIQAAFGYLKPDDTSRFYHYCVRYSPLTDTVKLIRQDEPHWYDKNGKPEYCPELQGNP